MRVDSFWHSVSVEYGSKALHMKCIYTEACLKECEMREKERERETMTRDFIEENARELPQLPLGV